MGHYIFAGLLIMSGVGLIHFSTFGRVKSDRTILDQHDFYITKNFVTSDKFAAQVALLNQERLWRCREQEMNLRTLEMRIK